MCWCQPSMRTPCCGLPTCHAAALRAGALKPGETCSFCHPPPRVKLPPGEPPPPPKRETSQVIRILTETRCPKCKRTARAESNLSEVEIQGWNVVGIQVRAAEDRKRFDEDLERRGWTDEMCGQCRDPEPFNIAALFETRAKAVGYETAMREFLEVAERLTDRRPLGAR